MALMVAPPEIRKAVRQMFNRVADAPRDKFRFRVGRALAGEVGYPGDLLDAMPPAAVESFTGLAYLHPHLHLQPGEHILDLGSGAGLDSLLCARAVGPDGSVTGLDIAEAMVARAGALAATLGTGHVRFQRAEAEAMPVSDACVDAALLNGLLNLCPDKPAVVRELRRVLKPGGRAVVAEITFVDPLPAGEVGTVDDWFR